MSVTVIRSVPQAISAEARGTGPRTEMVLETTAAYCLAPSDVQMGSPALRVSVAAMAQSSASIWRSTGRGMTAAAQQAEKMLDAFASAGTDRFDITFTDDAGEKLGSTAVA